MSWKPEIDELRRRESMADEMGGPEKVELQHSRGKLDVRERIRRLIDAGSLHEIGKISGRADYDDDGKLESFRAANFIFGRARIDARPVVVAADDFTVRGGSADATSPARSPRPLRKPPSTRKRIAPATSAASVA